jgi:hypothetical protein
MWWYECTVYLLLCHIFKIAFVLNCTCLLHVKWEMSSLYDMYIVHVLPVKEKKKFYEEDNFSTWESFLYFVLCLHHWVTVSVIDIDTCGDMNVLYIFCFVISLKLLLYNHFCILFFVLNICHCMLSKKESINCCLF